MTEAGLLSSAFAGLASIALLAVLTWLASLVRHDVSLVDRTWSIYIAAAALVYFATLPGGGGRRTWMIVFVMAWALRLSLYITHRNWGHGEDRRYREIRERHQPHFGFKSLYLVFALQTVLAWIVSAPLLVGMASGRQLGGMDALGLAIAAFGIAFEAIGDAQMARFKSDPAHRDTVMDRGLWRYTRHPNYFGEACTWWGLWLVALSSAGLSGAWSVISPLLMTVLLLKVSGVSLLEKDITERRPAYRDYMVRTSAFWPGPPRQPGQQQHPQR